MSGVGRGGTGTLRVDGKVVDTKQMERTLPWPTVALMESSRFLSRYLWAVLLAVLCVLLLFHTFVRTSAGRLAWDRFKLRVPLLGDLSLKIALSRFSRTLGVLLGSGVAILDALKIVARVVGNEAVARAVRDSADSVSQGEGLSEPLRRSGLFPPLVHHMIAVGERTGAVDERLLNIADAYDAEVESRTLALTSLLEPIMILVMGALVGFLVLAILLPIFEINQAVM
jgi:general secretion pathway protein F